MSATQRPKWEVLGGNGLWYVGTPGHERIRSTSLSSANRVATAVNQHDALVAFVGDIRTLPKYTHQETGERAVHVSWIDEALEALDAALGGTHE